MTGVIIAAGRGSRFGDRRESKPLCPVNGRPLIEWVILASRQAGITDFVVVTGYAREKLEAHLADFSRRQKIPIRCVWNEGWEKENGLSVYKAKAQAGESFALLMSDHIFDAETLARLMGQPLGPDETILAVDFNVENNPSVDLDDVTKVLVEDGRVAAVGKTIENYNAFDTGMFLCTSAIFRALEESQRRGDFSLSGGLRVLMESRNVKAMDIGTGFWIDIDDEQALERAENLLSGAADPFPASSARERSPARTRR